LVDDQEVIYAAGNAVGLPSPQVLKRKAVLVDAPKPCVEIGHNLLTADNEYDVPRSGRDWTELASAGRRDQQSSFLRDSVHAADDPVGRGGELTHLPALHFAIHLVETWAQRLIQPGPLDVFGDANDLERAGGVVIDLSAHREGGPHRSSCLFAGVNNTG